MASLPVTIADLFARGIDRRIEEVIKVDDADEALVREELDEYVVTASIRQQQIALLDAYSEARLHPRDGTAIWVSGFFGSGKSSFAKLLGIAIQNRRLGDDTAGPLLAHRIGDTKATVLLRQINEQIPTEAVIFDVSTDRGIRVGNQSITEIMYRAFLQALGYARELDLAELEITLEAEGRLDAFVQRYQALYGQDWNHEKGKPAVAMGRASAVMHALEPQTFNAPDSWVRGVRGRSDITPALLADRCLTLLDRRRSGPPKNLLFVIDEVGQFVARDGSKLEDLRAVVERLGQRGAGRIWVMVTSQEALSELVGGLDATRIELPKVKDRFPLQVHLEPSDISEVTSRRVLAKNAEAQTRLRALFQEHRPRLVSHTRLQAPMALPELTAESFIDLYPLLPYHIDLIINVVSGLRLQGGASKHVGGANRTLIKLAQQLLINPAVALAQRPIGTLATLDQVYDLVAGNITSEVRQKIDAVSREVSHPLAQAVAKAVCLLQYEKRIPRTAENIAATLHPEVGADSRLPEVKIALEALVASGQVRLGEGGYRIPTPTEDDWEKQRRGITPREGDIARLHAEVVEELWKPQPTATLRDIRSFKAGLYFNNRLVTPGDLPVHLSLAGNDEEWRTRSRDEKNALFWVTRIDDAVLTPTEELFRSNEMLSRRERTATSREETALVAEEKKRKQAALDELKRHLRDALLRGSFFFRGNDRRPDPGTHEVTRVASNVLGRELPSVFHRFEEAAARATPKDLDAVLTTENLRGLPPVFSQLRLIQEAQGKPTFRTETGPLAELLTRIAHKAAYGDAASGRSLSEDLSREPFGWEFDVVRLLVASLLRAGKIEMVSRSQIIDNALSLDARSTFTNSNAFRQATFRPKVGLDFGELVKAYDHFKAVFGKDISEIEEGVIARAIKEEVSRHEQALQAVRTTLSTEGLPGGEVLVRALDQIVVIRSGSDHGAIAGFNTSHHELSSGIRRGAELEEALTGPRLHDLKRARVARDRYWPFLVGEADCSAELRAAAEELTDLLARETFFRELPVIDERTRTLEKAWQTRFDAAVSARRTAFADALATLKAAPEWGQLDPDQQARVATSLQVADPPPTTPIAQIRAETEACSARLSRVRGEMLHIIDGQRVVRVHVAHFFTGGIDSQEQLDAALDALRGECERLLGEGRKVWIQ